MLVTSPVFSHGGNVPEQHTCLGANINPPLYFEGIPSDARSLVLVFEDTDASPQPWTHWMLFNIPPETNRIQAGVIPEGATEGLANNHSFGYEGPCPRYFNGTHHYWFRLYALDKMLELPAASEREVVEAMMEGHVIAKAALLGICTSRVTVPGE